MTKLVFIHVPIRNMYFLSGMEGFKKSEGRSTRGASSLQYWLRPPPQNWMRPYDSCSSAPTALMKKLSTANLLSIHVLILRIFVFGGATRIVGAGSRQSQIGLCKGVLLANPLPGASGLGKLTTFLVLKVKVKMLSVSNICQHFWSLTNDDFDRRALILITGSSERENAGRFRYSGHSLKPL